ncbi:hypothetical protein KP014_16570 [Paenibacillus sophorae]|uniref:Uncharacterized protein n=1 Tax=Paenibacillus sophorae TaxID=1333845 RepID=A0ABX8H7A9_9BACL|nr:hypothetical protein [Paenibacillus sophorae]QWU13602.1 hypothetical protein KP014_16570 [Paenibacillus sophorae]
MVAKFKEHDHSSAKLLNEKPKKRSDNVKQYKRMRDEVNADWINVVVNWRGCWSR